MPLLFSHTEKASWGDDLKRCNRCAVLQPKLNFSLNKNKQKPNACQYHGTCKNCLKARKIAEYPTHIDNKIFYGFGGKGAPPNHKICLKCFEVLPFELFDKHAQCSQGYNTVCKTCRKPKSKQYYANTSLEYCLWYAAKSRATRKNREFSLKLTDIHIPVNCPVLNVPLVPNTEYAPSIDRVDSSKGYTLDNICIISVRANKLKNNATLDEILKITDYMQKLGSVKSKP